LLSDTLECPTPSLQRHLVTTVYHVIPYCVLGREYRTVLQDFMRSIGSRVRPGGELVSADTMLARDHPATINIFCVLRCHRPSFHQPACTCHASTEMSFVHTILVYHAATAELRARFSSTLCSHAVCQLCGVEASLRQRYRTRFTWDYYVYGSVTMWFIRMM